METSVRRPAHVARTFPPWACMLLGLAFLAPVGIARFLTPDESGFGTHRQLFLPPCGLRAMTGIPCPFCGMTTSFALIAHGRVTEGIVCHPVGALLFALTLIAGVGLLGLGATGRSLPDLRLARWWKTVERVALGVFLVGWVYQLLRVF